MVYKSFTVSTQVRQLEESLYAVKEQLQQAQQELSRIRPKSATDNHRIENLQEMLTKCHRRLAECNNPRTRNAPLQRDRDSLRGVFGNNKNGRFDVSDSSSSSGDEHEQRPTKMFG
jgi:chromosome segregation ATPase